MNNPRPRYLEANRAQLALRSVDLEGLVPGNHEVRAVWAYVESLDLGPLYGQIQSVEGEAGRPAIDPRILMGLWLWATLDAVGSARRSKGCARNTRYINGYAVEWE